MAKVVLTSLKTKNFSDKDIDNTVERALGQLDFNLKGKIQNVVIKPNLCYYWDSSTGETTDPRIVSAVIDYIRNEVGKDVNIFVAEADASAMKTRYVFKVLGYDKLSQTKNVNLMNLSEGDITETKIKVGEREFTLPINSILLKADLIVNIPKLKTHNITGVTCALKNMFGAIAKPRKYSYHPMLSHVIVGVNKIVRSDIIVVDGVIARGVHAKKLGVIMAGNDAVASDFTAAKIMGFNPMRVPHLNLATKEHIGQITNIELVEDDVKLVEVKKNFPSFNYSIHKFLWNLQLKMLRLYGIIVGDVIPPVLEG